MNDETPTPFRYELWKFFADNHGLTLTESELVDIIQAVDSQLSKELSMAKAQLKAVDDSLERCKTNHAVFSLIYLMTHGKKSHEPQHTSNASQAP